MRRKIIAANWKMNMTLNESDSYLDTFLIEIAEEKRVDIVLVPPFTALSHVSQRLNNVQNVKLGAQNMHWEKGGAFTGEISAAMIRELFARYVVLGHSERRTLFGETDETVNKKTKVALEGALKPIVCIGETLAERLEKSPLPLDQALKYAAQIADALDRAHRAGVTHRDIKPQNIMLTRDGVKVLDFGLAKTSSKPGPTEATLTKVLTTEGTVVGTPQYMAPEQFEGREADARSDIWAFGAVLYEMATGQRRSKARATRAWSARSCPPILPRWRSNTSPQRGSTDSSADV